MRKSTMGTALALAIACVAALGPAAFGGGTRRVEAAQYNYTSGLARPGSTSGQVTLGFAEFETLPAEKKVSLAISDTSGRAVLAQAGQDVDGDGRIDWEQDFCASTERPITITGGVDLQVFVLEGECGSDQSIPTTGSVQAIFRSR